MFLHDLTEPAPTMPVAIDRFLVVCGRHETDAAVRLHFLAAVRALQHHSAVPVISIAPGDMPPEVDTGTCLLWYYNDAWAITTIRAYGMAKASGLSVCFGSDIRDYGQYRSICDIADCFAMPSPEHATVLALNVSARVMVVREAIDPAVGEQPALPNPGRERSLVWFGYSEGYHRGMECLAPVIQAKLAAGVIDRYGLLTNRHYLDPRAQWSEVIPFNLASFRSDLAQFTYAILSHAPGDLHVNSYIKSPNKVITALFAGLVPLATATPNYADLMTSVGLEQFLFASPFDLARKLDRLDPDRDRRAIVESGALERLARILSQGQIHRDLMNLLCEVVPQVPDIRAFVAEHPWQPQWDASFATFGECARALIPSGVRIARRWVNNR